MAKVPSGQTAASFDGSGKVWFKVYQDMPTTSGGQYTWPSNGTLLSSPGVSSCLQPLYLCNFANTLVLLPPQASPRSASRCRNVLPRATTCSASSTWRCTAPARPAAPSSTSRAPRSTSAAARARRSRPTSCPSPARTRPPTPA